MAPPPGNNVIPEPGQDRVKMFIETKTFKNNSKNILSIVGI